jgi:hypothetical protein
MKFVIVTFALALAAQAAGIRPALKKAPSPATGYCHTEIYCDWTGCHNIVVCN